MPNPHRMSDYDYMLESYGVGLQEAADVGKTFARAASVAKGLTGLSDAGDTKQALKIVKLLDKMGKGLKITDPKAKKAWKTFMGDVDEMLGAIEFFDDTAEAGTQPEGDDPPQLARAERAVSGAAGRLSGSIKNLQKLSKTAE